jgi:cell pole-organizing protein PopZ
MARHRPWFVRSAPLLLLIGGCLPGALPEAASAGPLVRRAQERKACQEFATKLQAAGGNTPAAQQVYQQGVLQLVARFGENPCTDIPAPTAAAPATPAPATAAPAAPAAPADPAANPQQQQACQQFAGKVQAASASGGTAAAKQTYAMGLQKLTGMFGSNPCPTVTPPQ